MLRPASDACSKPVAHDAESLFRFVLSGTVRLTVDGEAPLALTATDSFVVPSGTAHSFSDASDDLEMLESSLPADYRITDSS